MTAINLTNSPSNGDTATVGSLTYTYNSTTSRWELGSPSGSGALSNEQVQDLAGAQLVTNGSHTGISFAYDDSGDGAIDATVGTLNQNTTGSAATLTTPRNIGGVAFDGSADINLPGVNAAGTQNTTGSAVTLTTPREINGVAFNGSADITVPAGGVTVYATMALLVAVTGMSAGNMAYVTANNNLYMYTGTGWFKVATVSNNSPSAITGVGATTALATDGTATVITAVSTDPEGFPLTWSYSVTTGSLTNGGGASATVSQADNVFTITPTTTEAYAGTFSITFSATDGTNAVTAASAFTLAFAYDWTTTTQQQKIVSSDLSAFDTYGYSVGIDGDTVVVGAYGEDTEASDAGAAYVFTRSGTTWTQQQKLTASDAAANDYFGITSAISGDTIIVGAYGESSFAGAVYVFTRSGTTWSQQQKIVASDAQASDYFGMTLAISGDTVVVGAFGEDTGGSSAGSAYIFTRSGTTWSQQQKIQSSDIAAGDNFGYDVGIDGDTLVASANYEAAGGSNAGAAYIFTRSGTTWSQQQKIVASDAQANDQFGRSAAISGDTVVVGAYLEDTQGSNAGAVYIFTRSGTTWTQQQKIVSSDAAADDMFGTFCAIEDNTLVAGAYGEDAGGSSAGAAYIFTRSGTTWTQDKKIVASDAQASSNFGFRVGIQDNTIVVGAFGEDTGGNNAGAAYTFIAG
ncbi:FG-GAP repeat protein [bacterium]|nr:FG-GAP repeat protein [bacterium]